MTAALDLTEPGLYEDIPEDIYHRLTTSLSSTGARTLAHKTPAHFRWEADHGRKPKKEFNLGTAAHTVLLGRGADMVLIEAENYNKKVHQQERDAAYAAGKTPLLIPQSEQVQAMVAAVRAHPVAGKLFARSDCRPEVTFIGIDPETGVRCRARTDWLLPVVDGEPIRFVDGKSTTDASPRGMEKSLAEWNYNQQFDHYACVIRWALGLDEDYPVIGTLVAFEKDPPHLVGLGYPDDDALDGAHEDNRKARHRYARCTETGQWPGYGPDPVELRLPGWKARQYETNYPAGFYDPAADEYMGDQS